jgi:hypothetical protein
MKPPKKKKSKPELDREAELQDNDGRRVPFEALAELTSSDVIAQVKMGMSRIEPLELGDEFNEDAA